MTGDLDNDGIMNLLEYALASDPTVSSISDLPTGEIKLIDVGGNIAEYLTITFRRQLADTDLTYTVEFSENLESWDPNIALQVSSSNNGDGTATEVWRGPLPTSTESHWFTRLRVTN